MLAWLVVVLVGIFVVVVVVGLKLFPRLNAAQSLIDAARPAFTPERVAGDKAAIAMVATTVDAFDPAVTAKGGAAAEVPKLVAFVSKQTGLTEAAVLSTLQQKFPHVTGLLTALPLSSVSAELPKLVTFLATTLKMTPTRVEATLKSNFPHLAQAIANLPATTGGWDLVPGLTLTRFDGSPVRSVNQIKDYFANDVIPAVDRQQANFRALDSRGGVAFLAPLLLWIGIVATLFGLLMAIAAAQGLPSGAPAAAWAVVTVVGVLVEALVVGLNLFPRLNGANKLLNDLRPAFTAERVAGDRVAINMVSTAVDTVDPVVTAQGGAAAEVPKLVAFVSKQTGLTQAAVLSTLQQKFPHTTGLLTALPLSSVSAELPKLVSFLATTLKITPAHVQVALNANFPHLDQSIKHLPDVTGGWNGVPGLTLTRFDGTPVQTVPQVRDYFGSDVIPVLEEQQENFQTVDKTWPPLTVFPPLLTVVGLVVIVYGLIMLVVS
jgi:hypothetical protein